MQSQRAPPVLFAFGLATACSAPPPIGVHGGDASADVGSTRDSGPIATDARPTDAAGSSDTGVSQDSGPVDSGAHDSGAAPVAPTVVFNASGTPITVQSAGITSPLTFDFHGNGGLPGDATAVLVEFDVQDNGDAGEMYFPDLDVPNELHFGTLLSEHTGVFWLPLDVAQNVLLTSNDTARLAVRGWIDADGFPVLAPSPEAAASYSTSTNATIALAGHSGMPPNAQGVYLLGVVISSYAGTVQVSSRLGGAAREVTNAETQQYGQMWLPLDASQTISIRGDGGASATMVVLGWATSNGNMVMARAADSETPVSVGTTPQTVSIAGRAGIPADAAAAYVQFDVMHEGYGIGTLVATTPIAHVPRTVKVADTETAMEMWLPLDASQRVTYAAANLTGTATLVGWARPHGP